MQCGLESLNDCERSPNRTNLRVNFTEKGEAVKERREKFLTAKYGSHQMSLIRKRLAVEMWLYDELQKLFDPPVSLFSPIIFFSSVVIAPICFALVFNCAIVVVIVDEGYIFSTRHFIHFSFLFSRFHHHRRKTEAIDVDIDEILDLDSDDIRVSHLKVSLFLFWKSFSHAPRILRATLIPGNARQRHNL